MPNSAFTMRGFWNKSVRIGMKDEDDYTITVVAFDTTNGEKA